MCECTFWRSGKYASPQSPQSNIPEWMREREGGWVSGWVGEREWVSGLWVGEYVCECVSGWMSGWVSEWVSVWGECVCEWVCGWVSVCVLVIKWSSSYVKFTVQVSLIKADNVSRQWSTTLTAPGQEEYIMILVPCSAGQVPSAVPSWASNIHVVF